MTAYLETGIGVHIPDFDEVSFFGLALPLSTDLLITLWLLYRNMF